MAIWNDIDKFSASETRPCLNKDPKQRGQQHGQRLQWDLAFVGIERDLVPILCPVAVQIFEILNKNV